MLFNGSIHKYTVDSEEKNLLRKIKELHSQIEKNSEQSLLKAITLGSILYEQKKRIGHGNFINWINQYLPFSERTARNYLQLHKNKDKIINAKIKSLNDAYNLLKTQLPYSISKNDYLTNPKVSTIYTPHKMSKYLYSLLSSVIHPKVILDVGIGKGSLTSIWKKDGVTIIGNDIDPSCSKYCDVFINSRFEDIQKWEHSKPDLIVSNPPFNAAGGGNLYPEVLLRKMTELFGPKQKIVIIVPMGLRLNLTLNSSRWRWFVNNKIRITSIISLPVNIFGPKFHTEILCFNIGKLKAHYFLYE